MPDIFSLIECEEPVTCPSHNHKEKLSSFIDQKSNDLSANNLKTNSNDENLQSSQLIDYLKSLDPSDCLSLILSSSHPNKDSRFVFDEDVQSDAKELLGDSIGALNILQAVIFVGDEGMPSTVPY